LKAEGLLKVWPPQRAGWEKVFNEFALSMVDVSEALRRLRRRTLVLVALLGLGVVILLSVRAWRLLNARPLGDFTGIAHPPRLSYSHHPLYPLIQYAIRVPGSCQSRKSDTCTFTALLRPPLCKATTIQKCLLPGPARTQQPLDGISLSCSPS
jgi:hypothetical protein